MSAQSMYEKLLGQQAANAPPPLKVAPFKVTPPKAGVLIVFGATNWDELTKGTAANKPDMPNLFGPHRLVAGLADVKLSFVATSCTASHCVALSDDGAAFAWGRNDMGQLGLGDSSTRSGPTAVSALKSKPISSASMGKQHTLWVGTSGALYASGASKQGCVGAGCNKKREMETTPIEVAGLPPVASCASGGAFNLVIDRSGTLWSFGSSEFGVLGNGSDGAYNKAEGSIKMAYVVQATPQKILKLADRTVVAAAAGPQHCAALDEEGRCFTWGCGGYGRLGHRDQKDLHVPTELPEIRAISISCGSACTAAVGYAVLRSGAVSHAGQSSFYMWGRVKAASQNSWMYPQVEDDLRGWNLKTFACGSAHTVVSADASVIAWGSQCACGELGYGEGEKKTSARPKKCDDLEQVQVAQIACGMAHTLILAEDDAVTGKLPEWVPVQPAGAGSSSGDAKGAKGAKGAAAKGKGKAEPPKKTIAKGGKAKK